jgi:hypothetical protein
VKNPYPLKEIPAVSGWRGIIGKNKQGAENFIVLKK